MESGKNMSHKIVQRFEKDERFLDLCVYTQRSLDDDGRPIDDESWEVVIWENTEINPNEHRTIHFDSEYLARLFVKSNKWKEQVL